jgi:hypothetical protein
VTILNVSLNIPDDAFHAFLHSASQFSVLLDPPGAVLTRILDTISPDKPLRIFATGSIRDSSPSALMSDGWDTFYLAKWVQMHPGSTCDTVEIDPKNVETCRELLRSQGVEKFVTLWTSDSLEFMEVWDQPVDLFVLDSCDGLEHGLAEFKSALNFSPKWIIMDDYETKAKLAEQYAQSLNFPTQRMDRYTVIKTHL